MDKKTKDDLNRIIKEAVDAEVALIVEWLRSTDDPSHYRDIDVPVRPSGRDALASRIERREYRTVARR
jgi:hypothetical protein